MNGMRSAVVGKVLASCGVVDRRSRIADGRSRDHSALNGHL